MPSAYFIGICGVGMSAVARLLRDQGWNVSGSDSGYYPPIDSYLAACGIRLIDGYAAEHIPGDIDLVVIGKHAKLTSEDNVEVREAFARKLTIKSYPEIVGELTKTTENFVIAGSFGKSTCSDLAAWLLVNAGRDPSYMIGAVSLNLPGTSALGGGGMFVIEGDEYPSSNWDERSKFLHYRANQVLLTSCEHDHINVFPTLESYLAPFRQLIAQGSVQQLVVCLEGENIPAILGDTSAPVVTYSASNPSADWHAANIERSGARTEFDLVRGASSVCRLSTTLLGMHNVQNIVGVAALLLGRDQLTAQQLQDGIYAYRGIKRRLELKTERSAVPLYEDFGSSRAKVRSGLAAIAAQYPGRDIHVAFEPSALSFRKRAASAWYADMFDGASSVWVFDTKLEAVSTAEEITADEIAQLIGAHVPMARTVRSKEELLAGLENVISERSVVLVESSGGVGGAVPYLTEYLEATYG